MTTAERQHRWRVALAFGLVDLFWGSTYLAIRIGVEHIPPALMTGARFAVAGPLMLVACRLRGRNIGVRWGELGRLAVIGMLLLTGGNLILAWAEQYVPSGLAALISAGMPMWVAVLGAWMLKGERLRGRGYLGLGLGIAGLVVLLWPDLRASGALGRQELLGSLALVAGSFCWALGSVLPRRWQLKVDTFVAAGWEMSVAGAVNLALALPAGDFGSVVWTRRGVSAIAYLVVFGSWVGFSAFIWLLLHVPANKVSSHAYVNPVVADFLGWLILSEAVTGYILAGTVIVIVSVALVTSSKVQAGAERKPLAELEEVTACEPGAD